MDDVRRLVAQGVKLRPAGPAVESRDFLDGDTNLGPRAVAMLKEIAASSGLYVTTERAKSIERARSYGRRPSDADGDSCLPYFDDLCRDLMRGQGDPKLWKVLNAEAERGTQPTRRTVHAMRDLSEDHSAYASVQTLLDILGENGRPTDAPSEYLHHDESAVAAAASLVVTCQRVTGQPVNWNALMGPLQKLLSGPPLAMDQDAPVALMGQLEAAVRDGSIILCPNAVGPVLEGLQRHSPGTVMSLLAAMSCLPDGDEGVGAEAFRLPNMFRSVPSDGAAEREIEAFRIGLTKGIAAGEINVGSDGLCVAIACLSRATSDEVLAVLGLLSRPVDAPRSPAETIRDEMPAIVRAIHDTEDTVRPHVLSMLLGLRSADTVGLSADALAHIIRLMTVTSAARIAPALARLDGVMNRGYEMSAGTAATVSCVLNSPTVAPLEELLAWMQDGVKIGFLPTLDSAALVSILFRLLTHRLQATILHELTGTGTDAQREAHLTRLLSERAGGLRPDGPFYRVLVTLRAHLDHGGIVTRAMESATGWDGLTLKTVLPATETDPTLRDAQVHFKAVLEAAVATQQRPAGVAAVLPNVDAWRTVLEFVRPAPRATPDAP